MRSGRTLFAILLVAGVATTTGCSVVKPPAAEPMRTYTLDATVDGLPEFQRSDRVIAVSLPRAHPGLDGPGIAYRGRAHALDYYATSQWVGTPARMLQPLLVGALERSGYFREVLTAPVHGGAADLGLDTEIVALQQDFTRQPSAVKVALRAQVLDYASGRVVATMVLSAEATSASEDAYGGVIAANAALQDILKELTVRTVDALR